MSINFHANQYEKAFSPHRLQRWEVPKNVEGKYPATNTGFSRIKANDRGHLLPNIPRDRSSPWGTYVGTWDMPTKIPGNRVTNPTARSEDALIKGKKDKEMGDVVMSGALKTRHIIDPVPVEMDAPEDTHPVGMICVPVNGQNQHPSATAPCPQVETTHYDYNQPRATSRKTSQDNLKWPNAKSSACHSPVGNAHSPKPVTLMAVADIQREAKQRVSPLAEHNNNARVGGLKTPNAELQDSADRVLTPGDRIVGMRSPLNVPDECTNQQAEAAIFS